MSKLPEEVKTNVIEFVRLDDGLKKAREQMKEARAGLNASRDTIIEYMRAGEIERLSLKKGTQYLELVEKTLKVRPSAECVKAKLAELMERKVMNPSEIYAELNACGGTKQVWKLARRTKRAGKSKEGSGSGAPPSRKRTKAAAAAEKP